MAKEENEKEKNKPKPCPKWLNDTAKKEWRRVAKILAEGSIEKNCRRQPFTFSFWNGQSNP